MYLISNTLPNTLKQVAVRTDCVVHGNKLPQSKFEIHHSAKSHNGETVIR